MESGLGDVHANVAFVEGEDDAAIGRRAGGDIDEEVEDGLEQVGFLALSTVDCILFEAIFFGDELC